MRYSLAETKKKQVDKHYFIIKKLPYKSHKAWSFCQYLRQFLF